jgi:hypothetical protein
LEAESVIDKIESKEGSADSKKSGKEQGQCETPGKSIYKASKRLTVFTAKFPENCKFTETEVLVLFNPGESIYEASKRLTVFTAKFPENWKFTEIEVLVLNIVTHCSVDTAQYLHFRHY